VPEVVSQDLRVLRFGLTLLEWVGSAGEEMELSNLNKSLNSRRISQGHTKELVECSLTSNGRWAPRSQRFTIPVIPLQWLQMSNLSFLMDEQTPYYFDRADHDQ
jgi:hypothetical protein